MKQTKIVASISDRKCDKEFIRKLFFAGVDVVRMNTAHATPDGIKNIIKNVREVSPHLALMIDTKGPRCAQQAWKNPSNIRLATPCAFSAVPRSTLPTTF